MRAFVALLLFLASPAAAQTALAPAPGQGGLAQAPMVAPGIATPADAAASLEPTPQPRQYRDARLRDIAYDANAVVQLTVAPARQMTVMFASGEKIQSVAVGDSASWQVTVSRAGDSLFVKPTSAYAATNMTVITDTRTYLFDLVPGGPTDSLYLVRFTYPEAVGEQQTRARPTAAKLEHGTYRVHGARALRPDMIEDDGSKTYIVWREGKAMPAVFAIGPAGDEMLVDGYVRGGVYTVDRVYRKLIFRFDRKTAAAVRK
jgi:type IV secretion system protein VirB9